jgi:CHAD domain-containing protein
MVIGIAEILNKISRMKTTQEKIDALRQHDCLALRVMLQAAYDENVKFALPEGVPPYKPNQLVDQEHIFKKEAEKVRYFIEGFYPNLKQTKREIMFIEFLERLDPADAEMLCSVKDKNKIKGIMVKHISEALPGLLQDVREDVQD